MTTEPQTVFHSQLLKRLEREREVFQVERANRRKVVAKTRADDKVLRSGRGRCYFDAQLQAGLPQFHEPALLPLVLMLSALGFDVLGSVYGRQEATLRIVCDSDDLEALSQVLNAVRSIDLALSFELGINDVGKVATLRLRRRLITPAVVAQLTSRVYEWVCNAVEPASPISESDV